MDALIPKINELQNIFNTVGQEVVELPQIVVVGCQSSGKSSVLESIVKKSFLPRGIGIVTRTPLIVQLVNVADHEYKPTAKFLHNPNKYYTDFKEVENEIEIETKRIAGNYKGISNEPISLMIYSPDVVNLTLVDLPGLTKVPVGDQPVDIENQIKDLVLSYISNPNALILAVMAANVDMATNECLQLAQQHDPTGERTLGVITKLDLMDSGTNAIEVLSGHVIPIHLGIVGVVNRSQKENEENKSIEEAIKNESDFLKKHYALIAHKHGSLYLSKTLNGLLMNHIAKCLPDLKSRINEMKLSTLKKLGSLEDDQNKGKVVLELINTFYSLFCSKLEGNLSASETKELLGGARIAYIFHKVFYNALEHISPLAGLSKYDILTAMRNASGVNSTIFVPEKCFEMLVKKQIAKLREPSLKCVDLVHDEVIKIMMACVGEMKDSSLRYPHFFRRVSVIALDLTKRGNTVTRQMVEYTIKIELAYINTLNPEFRDSKSNAEMSQLKFDDINNVCENTKPNYKGVNINHWLGSILSTSSNKGDPKKDVELLMKSPEFESSKDSEDCKLIGTLIEKYFLVIQKFIQDRVPKIIMHSLVNYVKENLQTELLEQMFKCTNYDDLLCEPQEIVENRKELKKFYKALDDAEVVLDGTYSSLLD